ncbi:FtsK/SpoIIIE domain-containing protein [Rhodopseudomonas parapalustris]
MFGRGFISALLSQSSPRQSGAQVRLSRDDLIERERQEFRKNFGSYWQAEFKMYACRQQEIALAHYRGEALCDYSQVEGEQAHAFAVDRHWEDDVTADANHTISEIREGNDAQMKRWDAAMKSAFLYDDYRVSPGDETVMEKRRASRAEFLRLAKERVEEERRYVQKRRTEEAQKAARQASLQRPIPLVGSTQGIVFGSDAIDGTELILPVSRIQHMLVAGATGSGKSVFLHQLVSQLVKSDEVDGLILIDLKGGVEFNRYRTAAKVMVVWEFAEVIRVVDELVTIMNDRQEEMRQRGQQNWPGGRIFIVIDEYAEIQSDIDSAETREEKATVKGLARNLVRIARRARSLGIVLICALQKPTTDAMDSALRTNLNCRICLRVGSKQLAASVLDDLDDLPVEPTGLRRGRYIYYDPAAGVRRYMQTQIAPGVDLGGFA